MTEANHIENKLKELKPLLKEKYHVKKIGYFGSFANGDYDSESDVDILVEFSEPLGWEFIDLKSLLEERLHRSVDLVTKNALKKQMKESVLNQVKYL